MAQPFNVNDYVQVRVFCTNSEQASVNTFWYAVVAVGTPAATDLDMATDLDTGFLSTALPPMLNNLTTYNGVQVQVYRTPDIFAAQDSIAGAGPGTGGAVALPRQTAGLTHWQTPKAGRAYRGRTYWPFPATAHDTGDGIPTTAYVALMTTLANGLLNFTTFTVSGRSAQVSLVLKHRKNKAGVTPVPSTILSETNEAKWATQRRRGSFGRPNVSPI